MRRTGNCNCDIGIGSCWETPNRTSVAFLPSHGHVGCGVVVHRDNIRPKHKPPFFLNSFSISVWAAIAGLFVLCTFLKAMGRRDRIKVDTSDYRFSFSRLDSLFMALVPFERIPRAFQDTGKCHHRKHFTT